MEERKKVSSGASWEDVVGYSRAIRVGNVVEVAGTTAVDEIGNVVGIGNSREQTKYIILKMQKALKELGADLEHVVRTRMFVTDIENWEDIGRIHGQFFCNIKPVATMVEVNRLIHPDLLVEIEMTAII